MSFFVAPNEKFIDKFSDPNTLMRAAPDYYGARFAAVKELRDSDDGTLHKGNGFRRVASLTNVPMLTALQICEPDFLKDKRKFYDWLDRGNNRAYCTYQRPSRGERAAQIARDIGNLGKEVPLIVPVVEEDPMALVINANKAPANNGASVVDSNGAAFPPNPVAITTTTSETDPNASVSVGPDTTPANIFRGTRS